MDKSGIYIVSHRALSDDTGKDNPVYIGDVGDDTANSEPSKLDVAQFETDTGSDDELDDDSEDDRPYRGMGKDELLKHSAKPLWKTLRYICMVTIFLGWLALLVAVIALVIIYPRCRKPEAQSWWQKDTVYRIYVRSFQDSSVGAGDGIGDLNGIYNRLNYFKDLGVTTLSLSSIYQQVANAESDYDIIDHKAINADYGTMKDFEALIKGAHERDMKIIMDFIPGFTSNQHPWFTASRVTTDKNNPKRNYYMWENAVNGQPPSNWKSIYNGSAWTMDSTRGQYYLHQRDVNQPDLNLRSEAVNNELLDILKFWLDLGVDGFYIRESGMLVEDYDLRDNPINNNSSTNDPDAYDYYNHIFTYGRPENTDLFARWRYFLDDYANGTESYKLLFADVKGTVSTNMGYYGLFNRDGVDFPLNKHVQQIDLQSTPQNIHNLIQEWMKALPSGRWSNWLGGDDITGRLATRREETNRPLLLITMLLPGTPMVYYGDEIGMVDSAEVAPNAWSRRQVMRAPMQWDNSTCVGFCCIRCTPWYPHNPDSVNTTVQIQKADHHSMFHLFRNLTSLRKNPSFQYGDFKLLPLGDSSVIAFIREFDGVPGYLVAVNVGNTKVTRDLSGSHKTLPGSVNVVLTTANVKGHSVDDSVSTSSLSLEPFEGIVGSWRYVPKELSEL